jgi:hypothetical protein
MRVKRGLMIVLLNLVTINGHAAETTAESVNAATETYTRARKRLIADNLNLTAAEAQRFWPLYEQFEKDLLVLSDKIRAGITELAENYESMTDAMARKITIDRLKIDEERDRLRRAYLPKFEKVLPAKKLARYYQIESKIRAAVECGIAQELPLIK